MAQISWKTRRVLVTGGTGMIGQRVVQRLLNLGAQVRVASLDSQELANPDSEFIYADLRNFDQCLKVTQGMDDVFHVAGIKGSPAMATQRPASFFYPTVTFNTHMLEAARQNQVERYLFTSSVGVYSPAEKFLETDVWKTFPSSNDRFAGWAKRMGELQLEAYEIEYNWKNLTCVRPANVYGPLDNFDPKNAMVIPSLIRRIFDGENPLSVWGDGSAIRDFIFADDCAEAMIETMENNIKGPVNLGSGSGISIRELVETLIAILPERKLSVVWDTTKPAGDKMRILDMTYAHSQGLRAKTPLREGLMKTIEWYVKHGQSSDQRYNVFKT